MKFIGIILLLLTSIFLIACSANQASNKISNSELENLASKYGGVYVFNQKFVEEIEKREAERKELSKKMKGRDLGGGLYAVDPKPINEKFPQILSNGKQYYTINNYRKAVKLSKIYINKIIDYMGQENYYKFTPSINLWSFYIDDMDNIVPIELTVTYSYKAKKYGLFGDEGAGFSLSRDEIYTIKGGNIFYFDNHKNTFIKNK